MIFSDCSFGGRGPVEHVFAIPAVWIGESKSVGPRHGTRFYDPDLKGPQMGENVTIVSAGCRGVWVKYSRGLFGETDPSNLAIVEEIE